MIGLIGVLLAILMPTIGHIRLIGTNTASQARINEIASLCAQFKLDTKYYPGQRDRNQWDPNEPNSASITGNQALARCLFFSADDPNVTYATMKDPNAKTEPRYGSLESGDLQTFDANTPNTIYDRFGEDPLPVLYYPSRLGVAGLPQYSRGDNDRYTDPNRNLSKWGDPNNDPNNTAFMDFITDDRATSDPNDPNKSIPYNDRGFLLIGAGIDREYGTGDDIKNWTAE